LINKAQILDNKGDLKKSIDILLSINENSHYLETAQTLLKDYPKENE
jgi:hypothetical protein